MSDLTGNGFPISDRKRISDRTKPRLTKPLNQATASQPAIHPSGSTAAPNADRLAGLETLLTETWKGLPGHPGANLLAKIDAILGDDIPRDEFRAILANRRAKVRSFGLAEKLAAELRKRWDSDRAARDNGRSDRDRQAASDAEQIRTLESLRDDPNTPASERAQIESMLNDLHKTGNRAAKGINE